MGETLYDIVARHVEAKLQLTGRCGRRLWSAKEGRLITRSYLLAWTPSPLVDACAALPGEPQSLRGQVSRLRMELAVLWADLMLGLPEVRPRAVRGEKR
jgi:hypothetical protein